MQIIIKNVTVEFLQRKSNAVGEYGWPGLYEGHWTFQHYTEPTWDTVTPVSAKSFKKKSVINHFLPQPKAVFTDGDTEGFWIHRQIEGVPVRKFHLNSEKFHLKEERKRRKNEIQVQNYFTDNFYVDLGGEKEGLGLTQNQTIYCNYSINT